MSHPQPVITNQDSKISTVAESMGSASPEQFPCFHCDRVFPFSSGLERHMRSHNKQKPIFCSVCTLPFTRVGHLEEHMKIHTDGEGFGHTKNYSDGDYGVSQNSKKRKQKLKRKHGDCTSSCRDCAEYPNMSNSFISCSQCKETFHKLAGLQYHVDYFCPKKQYQCSECLKRFDNQALLAAHSETHTLQQSQQHPQHRAFHCCTCKKRFIGEKNFEQHKKSHEKEILYNCSQCPEKFRRKVELRNHKFVIHSKKTLMCPFCPKRFSQHANYNEHKRIHTGERPYQCDQCCGSFNKKKTLVQHMRTHTGEKPYQCECGKSYSQLGSLIEHRRTHTGEKPYVCSECNHSFISKSNLRAHLLRHGQDKSATFPCYLCQRKYRYKGDLVKHLIKTHKESQESVENKLLFIKMFPAAADEQGFIKKIQVDSGQSLVGGVSDKGNGIQALSQGDDTESTATAQPDNHLNQDGKWGFICPSFVKDEPPEQLGDSDILVTEKEDQNPLESFHAVFIKEENVDASKSFNDVTIKTETALGLPSVGDVCIKTEEFEEEENINS